MDIKVIVKKLNYFPYYFEYTIIIYLFILIKVMCRKKSHYGQKSDFRSFSEMQMCRKKVENIFFSHEKLLLFTAKFRFISYILQFSVQLNFKSQVSEHG